jgi:hypothetical protein
MGTRQLEREPHPNGSLYQAIMRNHPHIITSRPTLHHSMASALLGHTPSNTLHWDSRAVTENTTSVAQLGGERASPKLLGSIATIERGQSNQTCSKTKMKQEAYSLYKGREPHPDRPQTMPHNRQRNSLQQTSSIKLPNQQTQAYKPALHQHPCIQYHTKDIVQ